MVASSRAPPRSLSSVLRMASNEAQSATRSAFSRSTTVASTEKLKRRLDTNAAMVSYRQFRIRSSTSDPERLRDTRVFSVFKPPFASMMAGNSSSPGVDDVIANANGNREVPSVEQFVNRALTSSSLLRQPFANTHVVVENDVEPLASGLVLVSGTPAAGTASPPGPVWLSQAILRYEVLVHGHVVQRKGRINVNPDELWEDKVSRVRRSAQALHGAARMQIIGAGYYGGFPVTHLTLSMVSPISSKAPQIRQYIERSLKTSIVGDPAAATKQHVQRLQGDADFPRMMLHLDRITIPDVLEEVKMNGAVSREPLTFTASPCLGGLVNPVRSVVQGGVSMLTTPLQLSDGYWGPGASKS